MTCANFGRMTGVWQIYVAPCVEAEPDLDATPGANWTRLGATDGDQSLTITGELTMLSDNNHTGNVKGILPESGVEFSATLVDLTLEDMARVLGKDVADVITGTSGALAVKQMGLARRLQTVGYSLLLRGGSASFNVNTDSPYVLGPGQVYIPGGNFSSAPSITRTKGDSSGVEFTFMAVADDNQQQGRELGWITVQSS